MRSARSANWCGVKTKYSAAIWRSFQAPSATSAHRCKCRLTDPRPACFRSVNGVCDVTARTSSNERENLRIDRSDVLMGIASNGRRRTDDYPQQPRAEGHDGQARVGGQGKGPDRVCPYRSRGGRRSGWTVAAADRASPLWQCQRRHTADAVNSMDRNRSAAESAALARRIGQYLAFV